MGKKYLFSIFILLPFFACGQQQEAARKRFIDSVKKVYLTEAAIRNPVLRRVIVSTDVISRGNVHSELYGNKLLDGNLSQVRTTALVNVPVKIWNKNMVIASFSFQRQHFDITDITGYQPLPASPGDQTENKVTVGFSGTYTRTDSLFGRPVILMGAVTGLTNSSSAIQKMSYLAGVNFTLKQTATTKSMLGFLINIDPSIKVPFVPCYLYWHKYKSDLELNVNFPQQVMLRKGLSATCWASFGTTLSGTVAFFSRNQPSLPDNSNYSTVELKTGPGIECLFARKFLFGVNAGILTPLQSREFERDRNADDYFLKNKINSTAFLNFTLSVLPFL